MSREIDERIATEVMMGPWSSDDPDAFLKLLGKFPRYTLRFLRSKKFKAAPFRTTIYAMNDGSILGDAYGVTALESLKTAALRAVGGEGGRK